MHALAAERNSPAKTTTVVVPSPTLQRMRSKEDQAYLWVLRDGDVNKGPRCWVNNVEQPHDRSTIVRNGNITLIVNKLVHATRTQGSSDCVDNHFASIDVADKLRNTLRRISSFLQKDDSRLLKRLIINKNGRRTSIWDMTAQQTCFFVLSKTTWMSLITVAKCALCRKDNFPNWNWVFQTGNAC